MAKPYITTNYADLSGLEGEEVVLIKGYNLYQYRLPDKARVIKDYENTLLVELEYIESEWLADMPPRKILKAIPKAALATEDILLRRIKTGEYLTGKAVAEFDYNAEAQMVTELIWE